MKMASCLLECLGEADLDKYYPHFMAVGLQRIEQLAGVTMKDYPRLGVHNMDDQKRLFQLIKIIQSVSEGGGQEKTPLQPGCVYLQPALHRSGPRRQLHFDSSYEMDRNAFTPSELCDLPDPWAAKHPEELFQTRPDPHGTGKIPALGDADAQPSGLLKGQNTKPVSKSVSDSEAPIIHRVTHVSGYNYGVPQTCSRSSGSEKDGPWTETDKIRVCVRKRPLGVREERRGEASVVTVENNETVLIHEKKEAVNLKEYILQHVFYFDEVFSETFSNQDVYVKTAHPLIQHVFSGGNATCFAYGQTGAGKTYTMIGTQKNPGLYALAAKDIFQQLATNGRRKDRGVWISFYEIYCGQLYDLLNGRKRLFAREDGKHVVQIVGLREVQVRSVDLLLEMILKGSKERSTGATGVNSDSSRSHAIIQIQIKDAGNRKTGRISFIDLAGSERASDARESDRQTKMEGAEINQSLLALKECIRALDQEQAHTPFRQSKLTQVLKDSFIGNSKTCMIANISPSHIATEHTLNTLRYADRVKELKKRMKSSPCVSRSRAAVCPSPKRVQNSPSALGEKISPKKVKLGQQPTSASNTARTNPCPSVFLPTNVPLSSTPKTHSKTIGAKRNQAWLHQNTPVKGTSGKKKSDVLPSDKCPAGIKTETVIPFRGIRHEDPFPFSPLPGSTQRIQAVQPVQKQIVPRTAVFIGDQNCRSSSCDGQNNLNHPTPESAHSASKLAQQKERERHLRSYHQQFQRPPILQQKLQYQPMEKTLGPYKPQEIRTEMSSSPPPPTTSEGAHLDDYDDSDFSEDSFSYASTNKKERKMEAAYERISFFLHPETPEMRKSAGKEERLCDYGESQDTGRRCGVSSVSPWKKVDDTAKTDFWVSKVNSRGVCDSSRSSNTPEKPYCSQEEDLTSNSKKPRPPLSTFNHDTHSSSDLSSSQESGNQLRCLETKEKSARGCEKNVDTSDHQSVSGLMTPLTLSILKDNWSMELAQHLESQESTDRSGSLARDKDWTPGACLDPDSSRPAERSLESDLYGFVKQALHQSESTNMSISPTGVGFSDAHGVSSFLRSPQLCKEQGAPQKISPEKNLGPPTSVPRTSKSFGSGSSLEFNISHYGEHQVSQGYQSDAERSPATLKNSDDSPRSEEFPWNKSSGYHIDSGELKSTSPSTASPVHVLKPVTTASPKSGSLELNHVHQTKSEDAASGKTSFKDHFKLAISDSELEHLRSTLIQCIFLNRSLGEEQVPSSVRPGAQDSPTRCSDGSTSRPSSDVSTLQARRLEKAQQLVVQTHREHLDEMFVLCSREEALLSQMPHSDFKEYVSKLDELLLLKSKCIHGLRTQLQLFMACPQSAEPADWTDTSSS